MKTQIIAVFLLFAATGAFADTNLTTTRSWIVDGTADPSPDAQDINISVDKSPVGPFSELKIYFNFDGTNAMQVFSVRGSGLIQPSLPPPGEPGGAFLLTGYWDCDTGFNGGMAITDLEFRSHSRSKFLVVRGKISNHDSLAAKNVMLKFYPPETNSLAVDVRYRLMATRDICVDTTRHATQEEFQVARMVTNYTSPATNQNDRIRLIKLDDKICTPYTGCILQKSSLCADLAIVQDYVFVKPRKLADATLALLHTTTSPRNTPTLAIDFRSPPHAQIKGQGQLIPSDDPTAYNMSVWGNWVNARKAYKAGRSVRNFRFTLQARDPNNPRCDKTVGQ